MKPVVTRGRVVRMCQTRGGDEDVTRSWAKGWHQEVDIQVPGDKSKSARQRQNPEARLRSESGGKMGWPQGYQKKILGPIQPNCQGPPHYRNSQWCALSHSTLLRVYSDVAGPIVQLYLFVMNRSHIWKLQNCGAHSFWVTIHTSNGAAIDLAWAPISSTSCIILVDLLYGQGYLAGSLFLNLAAGWRHRCGLG